MYKLTKNHQKQKTLSNRETAKKHFIIRLRWAHGSMEPIEPWPQSVRPGFATIQSAFASKVGSRRSHAKCIHSFQPSDLPIL